MRKEKAMADENLNPSGGQVQKKSKKKTILIVIAVIAVIAIIGGAMSGGSGNSGSTSSGSSSTDSSSSNKTEQAKEKYTVSEEAADTSNMFSYSVTGKLTNNTDKKVSYVQVTYILKDADGAQVGTALANTNDLAAGGVWKFSALGSVSPDKVASFELSEVTGF